MPIVAYGYGIDQVVSAAGGDGLLITVDLEPDVLLEPEIQVEVSDTAVDVTVDDDIDIEAD